MRILGPNGTTYGAPAQGPRRAAGAGFALPDTSDSSETRATAPPRAATTIDGLLALQGVDDPAERRRRSVKHGRSALDVLDDLKIGLLAGASDSASLDRLRAVAADLKQSSGDAGLDSVLSQIELRVEVELAKASRI